ncbi:MAG: hypothetical protein PUP46_11255 [Endozoicomonas sp. (ex Botrylloides leachii)]|nr:hypothetical protein [Endozoicomonas sp. (ex Botrylloides leachii)]
MECCIIHLTTWLEVPTKRISINVFYLRYCAGRPNAHTVLECFAIALLVLVIPPCFGVRQSMYITVVRQHDRNNEVAASANWGTCLF